VEQLLARTGVPADRLILEITEGSVMEERERAVANLHALVERGICLSLDDFGTGYSSLSYLQQLPVNELKIDRSFVARLNGAAGAGPERALVRSIAALGRSLGLRVVAEGIETEQQLAELLELGCHVGQGYLISRPVPTAAMRDLLSGGSLPVLPFARSWSG
jgi:EAL domain-containing protein (putative c-di-GMP-specific phosphodiesterase class I)